MERGNETEKRDTIKLMGNQVNYDQEDSILVGPWGGTGGLEWNYKLKSPITEIIIAHGKVIDSIIFKSVSEQGTIDSKKFGGNGGGRNDKVVMEETPLEYLIGINGKIGHYSGYLVIKSLSFIINAKIYGPFGSEAGTGTPFSFVMKEGGAIVGIHGRAGLYLDSIGVYLQKHTPPNSTKEAEEIEIHDGNQVSYDQEDSILVESWGGPGGIEWNYKLKSPIKEIIIAHGEVIDSIIFRSVGEQGTIDSKIFGGNGGGQRDKGNQVSYDQEDSILVEPWGGTSGLEWNYKLKSPIREIIIAHGNVIHSIIFRSVSEQGTIQSQKFGGNGGGRRDKVVMKETPLEYLIGINGKIGRRRSGILVVKSLSFISNANTYGPFGSEAGIGTPFSFVMKEGGAIVGFHGRAGLYLDSIGVYLQKLTPPNSTKEVVEDTKIDEPNECIVEEIEIHEGNQVSYEQEDSILVEPWGGTSGLEWNYKLKSPIKEIIIAHEGVIV